MNKLIVIKGDPNAGKTTASRYLLESLLLMGANLIKYKSLNSSPSTQFKGDFEAEVERARLKLAICSRGDELVWVLDNIKTYQHCDIVIVTSRNYATFDNKIANAISQYGTPNCILEVVPKVLNAGMSLEKQYMDLADFVRNIVQTL